MTSAPPLFVIGNPRSGTTLFRLMLSNHKGIVIPPECGFAVWHYREFHDWRPDSDDAVSGLLQNIMLSRKFETWGLSQGTLERYFEQRRPRTYPEAVSLVYECYAEEHGISHHRWGDKNNFYLDHIPEIDAMFPDALFLHIVRDGRNVACSYRRLADKRLDAKYAPDLPQDARSIAQQWHANITKINQSFDAVGRDRVCELRLEDLKADPVAELTRVCDHLGEPYDVGMLDFHVANREGELEPAEFLQWKEDTTKPLIRSRDARYLTEMTPEELADFEEVAGDSLRRYGYVE